MRRLPELLGGQAYFGGCFFFPCRTNPVGRFEGQGESVEVVFSMLHCIMDVPFRVPAQHHPDPGIVHPIQESSGDGNAAHVACDVIRRVVGPQLLLVDVLLKDVPKHLRVDFVGFSGRSFIQVPSISVERPQDLLEGSIRDIDGVIPFERNLQEQASVDVGDIADDFLGLGIGVLPRQ